MAPLARTLSFAGALALAVAVGLDAWYAHGLEGRLDAHAYDSFGRGLAQHYVLGFALLFAGARLARTASRLHLAAGALFLFALLAFCGDVYAGALGLWHPGIAPQGGMAHILGWLLFAAAELRAPASRT